MRNGTKWLVATLAGLVAVVVLVPAIGMGALGAGGMGSGMMAGHGMMGQGTMAGCTATGTGMTGTCPMGGMGMMTESGWTRGAIIGLNALATVALWGAVIVAVVLAVRWFTGRTATGDSPLSIAQRRYAAGEIDGTTFAEIRAALNA